MVAIPQPAATVSFRPVQPEQMPLPQMGLHQAPPDQETQHLQQLFRQFLVEESPQIFQQFLQWRQMQSAQQQPMMPAPVQQTHPAPQQSMMPLPQYQVRFHMGATVSLQSPSPQMPHQRPLPTRDGTPTISPATPTRRTSVTPRRLNRSAQSKASSRGSKKEDRSSLAPIFDPANMVSRKKKCRRRRCKKHRADRAESEAGDQSEAEEVEVKQEVKQNIKQEASSTTFAAFNGGPSGANKVDVKREAMKENLAASHAEVNMDQFKAADGKVRQKLKQDDNSANSAPFSGEKSEVEAFKVKQEAQDFCFGRPTCDNTRLKPRVTQEVKPKVKQEPKQEAKKVDQAATCPGYRPEQSEAGELKVEQEVKQEFQASIPAEFINDRSETKKPKVKREVELENQASIPPKPEITHSEAGYFNVEHDVKKVVGLEKSEVRRYMAPASSNTTQGIKVKAETDEGGEKAQHDVFTRGRASKAFHEHVVTEVMGPKFGAIGSAMPSHPGSAPSRNGRDDQHNGDAHRSDGAHQKWNACHNEDDHMDVKLDWSDDDEDFKMKYEPLDEEFPYF